MDFGFLDQDDYDNIDDDAQYDEYDNDVQYDEDDIEEADRDWARGNNGIDGEQDRHCPAQADPAEEDVFAKRESHPCLLYTSPSPRDRTRSRMPSSA